MVDALRCSPRSFAVWRCGKGNRINIMWNSLPNEVAHGESTNTFKSRLDTFWSNQEIIYDYRAEIQGTGSRSVNY